MKKVENKKSLRYFSFEPGDGTHYEGFICRLTTEESEQSRNTEGQSAILYAFGSGGYLTGTVFVEPRKGDCYCFEDFQSFIDPQEKVYPATIVASYHVLCHLIGYKTFSVSSEYDNWINTEWVKNWRDQLPELEEIDLEKTDLEKTDLEEVI